MRCSLSILLLVLTACSGSGNSSDVAVYRVPKEKAAALPPELAAAPAPKAGMAWDVPEGWKKLPPAPMRVASFSAGGAEISIVSLPGEAGGVLANVNRWRGQLGLAPIGEKDLPAQTSRVETAAGQVLLADFSGGGKRMQAGLLSTGDESWFFKMTGSEKAVADSSAAFRKFLRSVRNEGR